MHIWFIEIPFATQKSEQGMEGEGLGTSNKHMKKKKKNIFKG
jgi:hypothetical protein